MSEADIEPITGVMWDTVPLACLLLDICVDELVGLGIMFGVGVDPDWLLSRTLPERGRESEERMESPVEDGTDAGKSVFQRKKQNAGGKKKGGGSRKHQGYKTEHILIKLLDIIGYDFTVLTCGVQVSKALLMQQQRPEELWL